MGDLTKNFSLSEFYVSGSHPDLARVMIPSPSQAYKCFLLSKLILQPLRDAFCFPLRITRGVASPELNQAQGGVPTSDHLFLGNTGAVDFLTDEPDNPVMIRAMYKWLISQCSEVIKPWGQLILETDVKDVAENLHVSLPSEKHFGECLIRWGDKHVTLFEGGLP